MTRMNMFSVGKITKYWLILFKIEVKILFCKRKFIKFSIKIHRKENYISHKQQATEVPFHL